MYCRHSSREETSPAFYYTASTAHPSKEVVAATGGLPIMSALVAPCPLPLPPAAVAPAAPPPPAANMLSASASVEAVTQWLSRNRFGALLSSFRNYSGRDLLRLSREDVISLCGLSDGLRLYNDLHMAVVAPRTTFYVALKDTNKYDALFLEDLTVDEFIHRFALCIGLQAPI
jgi:hypothetical protein